MKLFNRYFPRARLPAGAALILCLLTACITVPAVKTESLSPGQIVVPFSLNNSGESLPSGWMPWIISRFNQQTQYKIVMHEGAKVLEAFADRSASGISQEVSIESKLYPQLSWRWRVSLLPKDADLSRRGSDDSPARVIISFDGDHSKLDFEDRATANIVKLFSGRDMPYATLMYVWDNKLPANTLLDNAYSARAKMIVVESGPAHVGKWLEFKRNVFEDFKRAFNEMPGKIISVGVMSDTNRTDSVVTAQYGDIALRAVD